MRDIEIFDDVHGLIHKFASWAAHYKIEQTFESYLREHEPIRYRRLTEIYKFLEEIYEN